ncbi:hypothetical protein K2224_04070 [Streptomyces sp. BHT-5-2]|uniref:hypothetical protein n=1 Tax=Streptomyces sp. BHT-5-2 TaxID=2866715 RepID=UPI001C8DCB42|nr:hypothetical protein [Streptomyces sp. BHT-5-2]QZL02496.1 hypothetical protein K2224_04070 [Streptomyces sp. BHT-5-2]
MGTATVETYDTRTPDSEGWRGIPFRHPRDLKVVTQADGGKHDGGPMPPEAPRDPQPQEGDGK